MAVTGIVHPKHVIRNVGVRVDDAFVLTKALGTGIITTGIKRHEASTRSVRAAVASMVALNAKASAIMRCFHVHACSDVTGYGLLGHAVEMAAGGGVTIVLESASLPVLPGARPLAEQGVLTGGCKRNRAYLEDKIGVAPSVDGGRLEVALDPQTSGGLLIALPRREAPALVKALRGAGVKAATIVGHAARFEQVRVRLV
jgi:selenide,water dikinase